MRAGRGVVAGVLGVALLGCGVQPTGVVGAGEPASGLTRGMRLYFASDGGLRSVPLLDRRLGNLGAVVKLLAQGPSLAERQDGLTTLVNGLGGYTVSGEGDRVTVGLVGAYTLTGGEQAKGQLVCSLARGQSVLDPRVEADEVEVTFRPTEGPELGPYTCETFLSG
ncbi:GerMN domain-containing protein [Streptomyces sp. NPDC001889]